MTEDHALLEEVLNTPFVGPLPIQQREELRMGYLYSDRRAWLKILSTQAYHGRKDFQGPKNWRQTMERRVQRGKERYEQEKALRAAQSL